MNGFLVVVVVLAGVGDLPTPKFLPAPRFLPVPKFEGRLPSPKFAGKMISNALPVPVPPVGEWQRQCGPNGCQRVWVPGETPTVELPAAEPPAAQQYWGGGFRIFGRRR